MTNEEWQQIQENFRKAGGFTYINDEIDQLLMKIASNIESYFKSKPDAKEICIILEATDYRVFTLNQPLMFEAIRTVVNRYPFTNRETLSLRVVFNGYPSRDINQPLKEIEIPN